MALLAFLIRFYSMLSLTYQLSLSTSTVINLYTNQCSRKLGKPENARFLHIGLFQGSAKKQKAAVTVEMEASDNPALKPDEGDPSIYCTAFKKNRFYIFSRRGPDDLSG